MLRNTLTRRKKKGSSSRRRRIVCARVVALGLLVTLSLGTVFGPWKNSSGARKLRALMGLPLPTPTPAPFSPGSPSKEYIYAGGKLIATEEPVSGNNLAAPVSLLATTSSSSQVDITWAAVADAHHYEIERALNLTAPYTALSTNVTATSFPDTTVTNGTAYLYRVRAVDASGNVSPYSNIDVAMAITFTDDPLVASSTVIKAQHVFELMQAVNAVRATANLSPVLWVDSTTSAAGLSGVQIKAIHIEQLRSFLDPALNALGVPVHPWTDPALSGVHIKKIHIDELRQRLR